VSLTETRKEKGLLEYSKNGRSPPDSTTAVHTEEKLIAIYPANEPHRRKVNSRKFAAALVFISANQRKSAAKKGFANCYLPIATPSPPPR
jgi:hypothetical protein